MQEQRKHHERRRHRLNRTHGVGQKLSWVFQCHPWRSDGGHVVKHAVSRAGIDAAQIDDVILGGGFPEGATGMNIARQSVLRAGLPITVAGQTVNRFCASGLQAIATGNAAIRLGEADAVVGRHRVRRLMAKMGLEAIYKRSRTSQPHPQHPVYLYLLRQMQIDRPNQVLLSGSCCA